MEISRSSLINNEKFGIQADGSMSDAIITNNLISMNKGTGVYMGLGIMGFIYKNEITKNENGVIMISSQNKLMLNRITNNLMNGVYLMTKDDILNDSDLIYQN